MSEFVQILREGHKIQAIKALREATDLGLKEAKDAVEAITPKIVRVSDFYERPHCVVCTVPLGVLFHKEQVPWPSRLVCPTCAEARVSTGNVYPPGRD